MIGTKSQHILASAASIFKPFFFYVSQKSPNFVEVQSMLNHRSIPLMNVGMILFIYI